MRGDCVLGTLYWDAGTVLLRRRWLLLLKGRACGPVFVTRRRPRPGQVVSPRDRCPDSGPTRLSPDQARPAGRALRGPGTGWDLHEHRHASPTHLGEQGAPPLMPMAKSRHQTAEDVRRAFEPSPEAIAELTSPVAPWGSDR
ncbi:site-specific integrase [Streptomyces sp. NPDC056121]|uniref:site-specific integrase n=1 Tax=Streptomyces sp. NPDC056121 TaxID=3345718 RepID=UPI0035DBC764